MNVIPFPGRAIPQAKERAERRDQTRAQGREKGQQEMTPTTRENDAKHIAMRVEGQSMNLHYPDGSLVIACPVQEMGPRHGDHVIVTRRKGPREEWLIRELVIETGKVRLVPKSSDKRYQAAIDLPRDIHTQNGVAIVAVVVASQITRFRDGRGQAAGLKLPGMKPSEVRT